MSNKKYLNVVGKAIFVHLTKASEQFDRFEATMRIPEAEATKLKSEIRAFAKEELESIAKENKKPIVESQLQLPWCKSLDKDAQPVAGMVDFKIGRARVIGKGEKQWTFEPKLFTADNQPWDNTKAIYGGSKLQVSFQPSAYLVQGKLGITLRLVAVRVLELVTAGNTPADYFGDDADDPANYEESDMSVGQEELLNTLKGLKN